MYSISGSLFKTSKNTLAVSLVLYILFVQHASLLECVTHTAVGHVAMY